MKCQKRGNYLHQRCTQVGPTLSSLPLRKIPRSPLLYQVLSPPSNDFILVITIPRLVLVLIYVTFLLLTFVYSLCRIFCLRFTCTIFLYLTCCSDLSLFVNTFLKL